MDPLSVTASIVALITLSNGTFETLRRLFALRKSPVELAALINEITDLKAVLLHLECIGKDRLQTQQQSVQLLDRALLRAKDKLLELDTLIQYDLTKVSKSGQLVPGKIKWLLKQDKVARLVKELQPLRMSLSMAHDILHSSTSDHLLISLDGLVVSHDRALSTINSSLVQLTDRVRSLDDSVMPFIKDTARVTSGFTKTSNAPTPVTHTANNMVEIQASAMPAVYGCRPICDCACHTYRIMAFPEALKAILGQLSIGYYGLGGLTPHCNSHSCSKRQSTGAVILTYYFPTWFLQRAVCLAFRSRYLGHMEMRIHIPRVIPSVASIFTYVCSRDLEGVRHQFARGLASPWDVNEFGWSALHFAIAEQDVATCEYLITSGADLEAQTANTKETPMDIFHKCVVAGTYFSQEQENRLAAAMGMDIETPYNQLTDTHKIVLGRLNRPLDQELSRSPSDLNAIGLAQGTPLNWAAATQNTESVRILLEYGADQTIFDLRGFLPLHHAAWQGNLDCVRLLVEMTNATTAHADDVAADTLLKDLDCNASGTFKWDIVDAKEFLWARTPIMIALERGHEHVVDYLLGQGADINNTDTRVKGALIFHAIRFNSLATLKKLLARGADYRAKNSETRESLLHLVAKWADVETMQFLAKQGLTNIDIAGVDSSGLTPSECLSVNGEQFNGDPQRADAFQALLDSVKYVNDHQDSEIDDPDVYVDCVEHL